ncbi:MAG: insulinase family protein, partial [Alphaproteobacteria bacterium]|nr:insulinase family protein [Alphaproteobacteria bacterium]
MSARKHNSTLRWTIVMAVLLVLALAFYLGLRQDRGLLSLSQASGTQVERVVSAGGIEAWLVADPSLPVISLSLLFRGGAALDPVGKEGLAVMTAGLLDEGAGDLDSAAFQ